MTSMVAPVWKQFFQRVLGTALWSRLRCCKLRLQRALFQPRTVTHNYSGFKFKVHLADSHAARWYDMDWPSSWTRELDWLREGRLRAGARVFEIGAHQGVLAMMFSRIVGATGTVIGLEPNRHNVKVARVNCQLNDAGHVRILCAAGASENKRLTLSQEYNAHVDSGEGKWGRIQVDGITIDELSRRYGSPDVIYIDVEGFEAQVLTGAKETLAEQPDCFVEVHVGYGLEAYGGSAADVLKFFPKERWDVHVFSDAHPLPAAPQESPEEVLLHRFFLLARRRVTSLREPDNEAEGSGGN